MIDFEKLFPIDMFITFEDDLTGAELNTLLAFVRAGINHYTNVRTQLDSAINFYWAQSDKNRPEETRDQYAALINLQTQRDIVKARLKTLASISRKIKKIRSSTPF